MRSIDSIVKTFAAAGDSDTVLLEGGRYQLLGQSANWNSGSLAVEAQCPDGSTFVADGTLKLTADGTVTGYLSPGYYKLTLATTSAAQAALARCPGE